MFLQNPLTLVALFGLLVPLLIHLWERRQGRRVLVGSIRWLDAAAERRVSRLRFTDFWRWLLRSLIVVLFVLLLAGAGWRSSKPAPATRHWVLVEPVSPEGDLSEVLDSLRDAGHAVRWLAAGFPEWARAAPPPPDDSSAHYWSYLREIAALVGRPDTVTVLARPQRRHFRGERPGLPFLVQWRPLPEKPAHPLLAAAWRRDDNIRLLLARSNAQGLTFQAIDVPAAAGRHDLPAPFPAIELESGSRPASWQARLAGAERAVPVSPLPRRTVRLYYDRQRNDEQRYLRAALRAAAAFTGLAIEHSWLPVAKAEAPPALPPAEEWLFWLSEAPPPPALAAAYHPRLVRYSAAPPFAAPYFQAAGEGYLLLHLPPTDDEAPALDDRLPAELIERLFADLVSLPADADRRHLDIQQLLPEPQTAAASDNGPNAERRALHLPLWLLLCGLFLLERLTAPRSNRP